MGLVTDGAVFSGAAMGPPTWTMGKAAGEWVELPNSTLTAAGVGWTGTPPGGTGNYQTIVTAWGGGILNTVGVLHGGTFIPGAFVVIFGGGHGDYGGNEVYAYGPLQSNAPSWRRLTNPTIPAPQDVPRDGSGNPASRHTYDTLVYLPTVNKMLCIGAPGYFMTGFAFNNADLFDFATSTWSNADTGFPAFTGGGTINLMSGYDASTGKAWGIGNGNATRLVSFDVASSTWASVVKDNPSGPSNSKAGLSPSLGLLVFVSGATVLVQNLATPSAAIYSPSVTGPAPASGQANAIDWDSTAGCFVTVDAAGDVFRLTPSSTPGPGGDPWVWSKQVKAGATPAAAVANGTNGRFRIYQGDAQLPRGLVLMRRHDAPICYLKA